MGFSVTLSHIIIVVASVALASVFSAYAFYTGNSVQNELMQRVSDFKRTGNLQLEIVYATVDNSTVPSHFVVYAKNVGYLHLDNFTYLDVYVGRYGTAQLYIYSPNNAGSQEFNVTDANGNGIWEPRETVTMRVYPSSEIDGIMFEAKLVPFRGLGSSYLFPAP